MSEPWVKPSLVWNQLTTSSCFEACGVQRINSQECCALYDQFCILPKTKIKLWHCFIFNFCHFALLLKRKLQHVSHKWAICGSHSDCSVGQQVWRTLNSEPSTAGTVFCLYEWHLIVNLLLHKELKHNYAIALGSCIVLQFTMPP